MANADTIINTAIVSAKTAGNYTTQQIAANIMAYREEGKKQPSYIGRGKSNVDKRIAALATTDASWAALQTALNTMYAQQKAQQKAQKVAAAQVVPQVVSQVASLGDIAAPQNPMQSVLAPQMPQVPQQMLPQSQPVAPSAMGNVLSQVVPQAQQAQEPKGPREIKHGQVLKAYGDLRLVSGVTRQGTRTFWVADNYGKSVASLGKLELTKKAVAILEAVKAELAKQ